MEIQILKELIKGWDSERLSKAYRNWIVRCQDEESIEKVEKYNEQINAVLVEWSNRSLIRRNDTSRPELGLLKAMGYTVGVEGLNANARRKILKDIIKGPLPLIGNISYMSEWGEDSSSVRIFKIQRCLKGFIHGGQHSTHVQALQDWREDLDWLQKKNYENN
ncbi:hypothetical protein OAW20_02195 [Gammaproteobacteria bacterium]|nr:hypothetical protein [Gammaproteobacteria bacterium]